MTAAIALLAKERGGPKFMYHAMFYPVTDANFDTPSYKEFAAGPWLTKPAMEWFWNAYLPDKTQRTRITASPLRATVEQLKGLPPGLLVTDVNDVLRDEGEAYGLKLIEADVPITVQRTLGVFHDFMMLNALADLPGTQTCIKTGAEQLTAALT
jgi:acetyl esterase